MEHFRFVGCKPKPRKDAQLYKGGNPLWEEKKGKTFAPSIFTFREQNATRRKPVK